MNKTTARALAIAAGTRLGSAAEVPDMYGRPWAHVWEKYWEQGMQKPEGQDIFDFEN